MTGNDHVRFGPGAAGKGPASGHLADGLPVSRTLWGGAAQGIMGTHEWRFAQSPAGVHVITTESWAATR